MVVNQTLLQVPLHARQCITSDASKLAPAPLPPGKASASLSPSSSLSPSLSLSLPLTAQLRPF